MPVQRAAATLLLLACSVLLGPGAWAGVEIEAVSCLGLGPDDCTRLSNGTVEVVVTTGVGPRIARYAFVGGDNLLAELPGHAGAEGFQVWGGHRLWSAPEVRPRTYAPDNSPVGVETDGGTILLRAPVEESTLTQKELSLTLDAEGTRLTVRHRIVNRSPWPIELASWGLSVMNTVAGGTVIVPQEPFVPHGQSLLPVRRMILWSYTDLTDSRWSIGRRFVRLTPDPAATSSQKLGFGNRQGWVAYLRQGTLLLKRHDHEPGATYPDQGSSLELFTSRGFLELETLGPLVRLEPGEAAGHVEIWTLHRDITIGETEDDIEAALAPILATDTE